MFDPGYYFAIEVDGLSFSNICLGKLPITTAIRTGEMRFSVLPKPSRKITAWFGATPGGQRTVAAVRP